MSNQRSPFSVIKSQHVTEKTMVLLNLKDSESNPCVKRCLTPKYVFLVDPQANKTEIAWALEEIYKDKKIKVLKVNTLTRKPKPRRVRGRLGVTAYLKKAIVTLRPGDSIENV